MTAQPECRCEACRLIRSNPSKNSHGWRQTELPLGDPGQDHHQTHEDGPGDAKGDESGQQTENRQNGV